MMTKTEIETLEACLQARHVLLAGFYGACLGILDPDLRGPPKRSVERIDEHLVRMKREMAALDAVRNALYAATDAPQEPAL